MFNPPIFPAPNFTPVDPRAREAADWAWRMEAEFAAMRDAHRPQPESRPCAH